MDPGRFIISDHHWVKMEAHRLGRESDPGGSGKQGPDVSGGCVPDRPHRGSAA